MINVTTTAINTCKKIFEFGQRDCTRQEKNHALFPGKNLFISLHHGSNFILINKATILLHKYFNLCILCWYVFYHIQ
jgi:hypothetical protein